MAYIVKSEITGIYWNIEQTSNFNFQIYPKETYPDARIFDNPPIAAYQTTQSNLLVTKPFVFIGMTTVYGVTVPKYQVVITDAITDTCIYIVGTLGNLYTISSTLNNCVIGKRPVNFGWKSKIEILVYANENCIFETAPTLSFQNANGSWRQIVSTIQNHGTLAIFDADLSTETLPQYRTITFHLTANATAQTAPTPTGNNLTVLVYKNNCTLLGLGEVTTTTQLNLTATANEFYFFDHAPQLNFQDLNGTWQVVNFNLSTDKLTATLTADLSQYNIDNRTVLNISCTAIPSTEYLDKYGTINIYKLTTANLLQFAAKRYTTQTVDDLAKYVFSVKRIYANIGNTVNDTLKCGNYNTNIDVETPMQDNLILNCGNILIPYYNQSITDYENTKINLFLPFYGWFNLDNKYLNKNINVQYKVSLITGLSIILLSVDNNIIETLETDVTENIIFKVSELNLQTIGTLEFNENVFKGLTPYAIVTYYEDINEKIYNNTIERKQLNLCSGYNVVTELTEFENNNITNTEYNLIINQLQNGVIF